MKTFLLTLSMALAGLSLGLAPLDADARRFGGGGSVGMQRQAPPPRPAEAAPAPPAQHNGSTASNPAPSSGGAAAAGQRSWMGPIAGLAAGLGLAALASHLGFGETLAHAMTLVLIALLAFVLVRWLLRRSMPQPTQGGLQYAGATAAGSATPSWAGAQGATAGVGSSAAPAAAPAVTGASPWPADFDRAGFERIAKMLFIRMQAAHDAGEVEDLRKFTTPELFAAVQLDLHERRGAPQRTDVLQLDAQVVDVAQEEGQQVVSVRFHGLIREAADAAAEPFDELWHFVKPLDGHREWAIAGITQNTTPPALH